MPLWNDRSEAWHEVLPGVHRRILAHAPDVMMVLYRIDPGRQFPMHTHPHTQSGVVLEGGGSFQVGDAQWTLKKGSAYSVPGNVPHEFRADPTMPVVILDVFTPRREELLHEALPADRE
jgi:quercetin dioxygenase-like cupin family protein